MYRKIIVCTLLVFTTTNFYSVQLFAQQAKEGSTNSSGRSRTSGMVVSISWAIPSDDLSPTRLLSIGKYFKSGFGVEANALVESGEHVVTSGNILWYPNMANRVKIFGTAGFGLCNCQDSSPFVNFGGGVIVRMTDQWNARTEFRKFGAIDGSWDFICAGISYFRTHTSISPRKFHVFIGPVYQTNVVKENIQDAFNKSEFYKGNYQRSEDSPDFYHDLAVEYSLSNQVQVGVAITTTTYFQEFNHTHSVHKEVDGVRKSYSNFVEEEAQGDCYSLLVNYVIPRFKNRLLSRFESSFGAGFMYSSLSVYDYFTTTVSSHYFSPERIDFETRNSNFSVDKNVVGLHVQGSMDFYVTKGISLQFKIAKRFLPRVEVPEYRYFDLSNNTEKTLTSHSIDFSSVGISCGLRAHL